MKLCRDFAEDLASLPRDAPLVHLRLLATTDLHATLLPYDYYTNRPDPGMGLIGIADHLQSARAATPNCLLFDNGDTLQGAPLGDVAVHRQREEGSPHPMIAAMNALRYDAATLGNHDFDFGLPFLDRALAGARFPVVLANAVWATSGIAYRHHDVILLRRVRDVDGRHHDIRIGVTGTTPPQVGRWNRLVLDGRLIFIDALAATRRSAASLKARGADIVVALAHCGLGDADDGDIHDPLGRENTAREIADLPDVDVVVAGHTHDVHPRVCDCDVEASRTPIVQPGALGSHLGCIDLALRRHEPGPDHAPGKRPWHIERAHVRAHPVHEVGQRATRILRRTLRTQPALGRQIRGLHHATRTFVERELGAKDVSLNTYFSTVAPCAATQLIADAQRAAALDLLEGDADLRELPLLSAAAPMRLGGPAGPSNYTDIPPGALRLRHVSDLYGYPNHLAIVRLTGAEIAAWLERAAAIYRRIDPERPDLQELHDPAFAGYNFDRIDGLTYDIDLSRAARTDADGKRKFPGNARVSNIRFAEDGRPCGADEEVLVATNTYRAGGGGNFDMISPCHVVRTGSRPVRDHIAEHVQRAGGPIRVTPRRSFTLKGFGQARPVLPTGCGAVDHRAEYEALGLVPCCMVEDGFQRFLLPT